MWPYLGSGVKLSSKTLSFMCEVLGSIAKLLNKMLHTDQQFHSCYLSTEGTRKHVAPKLSCSGHSSSSSSIVLQRQNRNSPSVCQQTKGLNKSLQAALHPCSQPCYPAQNNAVKQRREEEQIQAPTWMDLKPCLSGRAPIQGSPSCTLPFTHNSQKM